MPHLRIPLVLAALLAAVPSPAPADEVLVGVVTRPVDMRDPDCPGVWVDTADGEQHVMLEHAKIVWHLDHAVTLPLASLQPGTRVRVVSHSWRWLASRVDVVSLGPHAMEYAVEEWVVQASGNRPDKALAATELASLAALGAPCWQLREQASDALRGRGMAALRLLAWCRHSDDAEVRARAEALLVRLGWSGENPEISR